MRAANAIRAMGAFGAVVRQLQKKHRGEIFQVRVPSRRFSLPCPSPLAALRAEKAIQPVYVLYAG